MSLSHLLLLARHDRDAQFYFFHNKHTSRHAILDAHSAYTNPRFLIQIGRDVNACIEAGKSALVAAYGLDTVKH